MIDKDNLDKDDIVAALVAEWAAFDELITTLTPGQWAVPTALPAWSVHDNVAHVVGDECALTGVTPPPCEVDVRGLPHVRNDIGAMNETWVLALRDKSPAWLLDRFREATKARRAALEGMSPADFAAPSWTPTGRGTYGRFMRIRLFDIWMHEQDIREALGLPGHESGPCAEMALSEMAGALGYVVGKRAAAPDGAAVTIELTGPVHVTWHIAVDGRAAVVDELPRPATTTLRMHSTLFTRLFGGRVPVADRLAEIAIDGDVELGHRVATALPVTI